MFEIKITLKYHTSEGYIWYRSVMTIAEARALAMHLLSSQLYVRGCYSHYVKKGVYSITREGETIGTITIRRLGGGYQHVEFS